MASQGEYYFSDLRSETKRIFRVLFGNRSCNVVYFESILCNVRARTLLQEYEFKVKYDVEFLIENIDYASLPMLAKKHVKAKKKVFFSI